MNREEMDEWIKAQRLRNTGGWARLDKSGVDERLHLTDKEVADGKAAVRAIRKALHPSSGILGDPSTDLVDPGSSEGSSDEGWEGREGA